MGAKKDGTITAVEARVVLSNPLMPLFGVVQHLIENTRIPQRIRQDDSGAGEQGDRPSRRGASRTRIATPRALSSTHVAAASGMDPVEVALKNDGAEGHDMEWLDRQQGRNGIQGAGLPRGVRREGHGGHRLEREVAPARNQTTSQRQDARHGLYVDPRMGRLVRVTSEIAIGSSGTTAPQTFCPSGPILG